MEAAEMFVSLLDHKPLESLTSVALFTSDTYIPTYQITLLLGAIVLIGMKYEL